MSDEQLRQLERLWRASGEVEDEVALLRARLRAGLLDEQRVRLAAGLGHAAATALSPHPRLLDQLVETETRTVLGRRQTRWNALAAARARWKLGDEALRRVAASAARCGLQTWEAVVAAQRELPDGLPDPASALRALAGAITGARPAGTDEVEAISEHLHELVRGDLLVGDDAMFDAINAIAHLADALTDGDELEDDGLHGSVNGDPAVWCVALAMNATSAESVAAALRDDVAVWALGHGDPLREWAISTREEVE